MTEQRIIELIHAELDGELTPEERAELSRALLADPDARVLREQWSRVFGTLEKLESVAPPAELGRSVLAAIERIPARLPARAAARPWFAGPALRYAAVFVGALLIGAALFGPGIRSGGNLDVAELVGTIGSHPAAQQSPIDRAEIALSQVHGTVNSYRLGPELVLELDLEATEPVEVHASYGGRTFQCGLGATPGSSSERVLWLPDAAAGAGSPVRFQVYGGGQLLHQGTLRSSAEP